MIFSIKIVISALSTPLLTESLIQVQSTEANASTTPVIEGKRYFETNPTSLTGASVEKKVIRKRITYDTIESISKIEEKTESISFELSGEDKKYILEIEKQKLKREVIVRRKEWKRFIIEGKKTVELSK